MDQQDAVIQIYDTTLRDGTQQRGISLTVEDKLRCVSILDTFGVDYIEGGWPGSNPKDEEFFERAKEVELKKAKLVAFGSTRRKNIDVAEDRQVATLLAADTPVITLVGKASVLHVEELLGTTKEENCRMIADTVRYCVQHGREVIFDAEHFFDGYILDPMYATECLLAACQAGASVLVLCDTNGGTLPSQVSTIVREVGEALANGACSARIGIHTHNDAGCAVANSLLAVEAGATHVQGTINGYGERCGNANLVSILPALLLKLGYRSSNQVEVSELTRLSRLIAELVNENHAASQPYVGRSAFAHKGGLHVAAVEKNPSSYEHISPELVGNSREIVMSELSGRGTVRMIAKDQGLEVGDAESEVLSLIKEREHQGYAYESADGSVELLMRKHDEGYEPPFELLEAAVYSRSGDSANDIVQATVKVAIGGEPAHTVADGSGPVHALDLAIRKALLPQYPALESVRLSNYKVRILNPRSATKAKTRVMIEAIDQQDAWVTVGCSENIIAASAEALLDSYELYLSRGVQRTTDAETKEVVGSR